jgi:single-strand DNA-binding protein
MSVNKVILIGRVGQQPELKSTPSGTQVSNFSLAVSETWNDKQGRSQERTDWIRIVAWGKLAEICAKYLLKGKEVYIEGKLQVRDWEDKEGNKRTTTEVLAQNVTFIGNNEKGRPEPGEDREERLPF